MSPIPTLRCCRQDRFRTSGCCITDATQPLPALGFIDDNVAPTTLSVALIVAVDCSNSSRVTTYSTMSVGRVLNRAGVGCDVLGATKARIQAS